MKANSKLAVDTNAVIAYRAGNSEVNIWILMGFIGLRYANPTYELREVL